MAGIDERDDPSNSLGPSKPLPQPDRQDPEWPRMLREKLERD
jgi:hypothetical protein